jgi:hypothetical protein
MKTSYPSKDFTKTVRTSLETGATWSVIISSGWRLRWIKKSIAIWPRKLHQPLNGTRDEKRAFTFCMFFIPTLMTMHSSSISVGYEMTHQEHADSIEITYTWQSV